MNAKHKSILLLIISILIAIIIFVLILILCNNLKDNSKLENNVLNKPDLVINQEETTTNTNTEYNLNKTSSTHTSITSVTKKTSSSLDTTTKKTTTTTTNILEENKEEEIIAYAKTTYTNIKEEKSLKENIKEKFITLVDFIFYDKEIKGITFKELSDDAKEKVLYYVIKADHYIESKLPNYKETINSKISDLKSRLIAKYMDISYSICIRDEHACNETKANFQELKDDLKLTWDIVSSSIKYGALKVKDSIEKWYLVFSGKI